MPLHPLTNFEIQNYYQKEPKINGIIQETTYLKKKGGPYIINLDEYKSIGTHWIVLHINDNNVTYFDSFGVEHIPKKFKKL